MGNLLFSPSGRIGPGQFMSGVTILVVVGAILGLIPILVPALSMLGIIGFVLIWCWVVLWVKRYHDGGKSGWMTFLPIIAWLVIGFIVGLVLSKMFADPVAVEATAQAMADGDWGTFFELSAAGGMTKTGQLINVGVGAVVSYVVAMVFNGMIKHNDHDNQYGPEPVA